jgi:hypothetical protein
MSDQLLPLPLIEHRLALRGHAADIFGRRSLADAMDGQGLASRGGAREPSSRKERFLPASFPPERPDQMPGMWRRYYRRWRVATRERLDLPLLEVMLSISAET